MEASNLNMKDRDVLREEVEEMEWRKREEINSFKKTDIDQATIKHFDLTCYPSLRVRELSKWRLTSPSAFTISDHFSLLIKRF